MTTEALLAQTMLELADSLVEDFDVVDLLTVLSDRCVEVLDVQAAGVMLVTPDDELRVLASSSELMRGLELFEEQAREGPCFDCYTSGAPVVNEELTAAHGRWPDFAPLAVAAGFHSVHALPMHLRDRSIGALNLFRTERGELAENDLAIAQGFADMATITILQHRTAVEARQVSEQLDAALRDRIVIEQAKGVISQRTGLRVEKAFDLLRDYATLHRFRLIDVAQDVIDGTLPADALDAR